MKVEVITPRELGPSELEVWTSIQAADPDLGSPYFHPAFSQAVGAVRDDARVALIRDGQELVGFFPFQRGRLGFGEPIGGRLSDYHGLVARPGRPIDARALVRRAGLAVWTFDHLPAAQSAFVPFHAGRSESPILHLADGFDAYLERRGGRRIRKLQGQGRKLEREVGALELVTCSADPALFETVIRLKSQQCRRAGSVDFFSELGWTVPLMRRILAAERPGFRGMLSALYADGQLAAAHLGMRSDRVLHWWFPVYDPDGPLVRYSPGSLLLLRMAEAMAADGVEVLDLGKGDDPYKARFATGAVPLAEGAVETVSVRAAARRAALGARRWLKTSPALGPLRARVRRLRARAAPSPD